MLGQFHFLRPDFLWLFLALPALVLLIFKNQSLKSHWEEVCDPHLLKHLLKEETIPHRSLPLILLILSFSLAILALSGPTYSRAPQPVFRNMQATVIALDLSNAMFAKDLHPNRLSRAKFKVKDILNRQNEGQIGLVAFTEEAFVVSPLTEDAKTLSTMVPVLNPNIVPVQGENISAGLLKASELLEQGGVRGGEILLITANAPTSQDFATAKTLHEKGQVVSVLGVATAEGAPIPTMNGFLQDSDGKVINSHLEEDKLKQLATIGGGAFMAFTNTDADIAALLLKRNILLNSKEQSHIKINEWKDSGRILLLLLLPLAGLAFS